MLGRTISLDSSSVNTIRLRGPALGPFTDHTLASRIAARSAWVSDTSGAQRPCCCPIFFSLSLPQALSDSNPFHPITKESAMQVRRREFYSVVSENQRAERVFVPVLQQFKSFSLILLQLSLLPNHKETRPILQAPGKQLQLFFSEDSMSSKPFLIENSASTSHNSGTGIFSRRSQRTIEILREPAGVRRYYHHDVSIFETVHRNVTGVTWPNAEDCR